MLYKLQASDELSESLFHDQINIVLKVTINLNDFKWCVRSKLNSKMQFSQMKLNENQLSKKNFTL